MYSSILVAHSQGVEINTSFPLRSSYPGDKISSRVLAFFIHCFYHPWQYSINANIYPVFCLFLIDFLISSCTCLSAWINALDQSCICRLCQWPLYNPQSQVKIFNKWMTRSQDQCLVHYSLSVGVMIKCREYEELWTRR